MNGTKSLQTFPTTKATKKAPPSPLNDAPPEMWFVEYLTPYDAYHHGIRELLYSSKSPYQSITIADVGPYGRALFLDGKIQLTERDEHFYHEPIVHVPCVQFGTPRNVLILGGADGGAAREALRWKSVQKVVVVDIDQEVVDASQKFLPSISRKSFQDHRVELIVGDALKYVDECTIKFDVVINDLTDPIDDGPSLNLFTAEFFKKVKACMSDYGALSLQVGTASLVESSTIMPRICATLRAVFLEVHPYQVFVPTFGSPIGMAVVQMVPQKIRPSEEVEQILKHNVRGHLSALDGPAFSALFALPPCTRRGIEEEHQVITEESTVKTYR